MAAQNKVPPFVIKDCALIAIASGRRAQNLRELCNVLSTIDAGSIYYHFWGGRLRPRFDDPEYHNDFSIWAHHGLHDKILAERLSLIDPTDYPNLEELRQELVEVVEERLDELEFPPLARHDNQFEFIRSQIVIFDTQQQVQEPGELVALLPGLSVGSIFYHFIDAQRRNENHLNDFQNWIKDLGAKYRRLCHEINEIDPYFSTLTELRQKLAEIFTAFFAHKKRKKK
ncbi:MAG: DUF5752 family protein [bacterium]